MLIFILIAICSSIKKMKILYSLDNTLNAEQAKIKHINPLKSPTDRKNFFLVKRTAMKNSSKILIIILEKPPTYSK